MGKRASLSSYNSDKYILCWILVLRKSQIISVSAIPRYPGCPFVIGSALGAARIPACGRPVHLLFPWRTLIIAPANDNIFFRLQPVSPGKSQGRMMIRHAAAAGTNAYPAAGAVTGLRESLSLPCLTFLPCREDFFRRRTALPPSPATLCCRPGRGFAARGETCPGQPGA